MNNADLDCLKAAISRFVKLEEADWQLLVPFVYYREIPRQQYWIQEGKMETEIGLVLEGSLRHYYTKDGEEKTTYFYFEHHFVGSYISSLTASQSLLTIEALTHCRLLAFPFKQLQALYEQSKAWERFGRVLAEYLAIGLEERMVGLLTLSPEERYIQLLQGNKQKIIERIPQHYIASYLGITPVSLSRIRNRLLKK